MKIHIPAYEPSLECTERLRHGEINIDLGEDVVEVVRCKDCMHYVKMDSQYEYKGSLARYCCWHSALRGKTDYCSDGVRRSDTE